jgi:16S rRNA G1207 methylase RsmC
MTYPEGEVWDRIIANPPFSKNQDIAHIRKMYNSLKSGGKMVSISSKHWRISSGKKEKEFEKWLKEVKAIVKEIPPGEFKESGTMVETLIIMITKK